MHLHLDAQADDRVFWFSTTGWMMWNFLVGVLLTQASIVLYDGNPAGEVLWDLAADAQITVFGGGAAYFAGAMKEGIEPAAGRDLSKLHAIGSTGSPLSPEAFAWIYDKLGADTWLFSTVRRHRRLHRVRRRRPDPSRLRGRAAGPVARRQGRGVVARGRAADRRRSASWSSPSRCRRCPSASGTTPAASATARATSRCSPASGATATGSRSPIAAPRSSTAAATAPSTAAASGWAPARSTAPSSPTTTWSTPSSSTSRARARRTGCRCSSSCATASSSTTTSSSASRPASGPTARPATSPTTSTRSPRSPAPSAARSSRSPSNASSWAPRPTRPPAATASPTPPPSTSFSALAAGR